MEFVLTLKIVLPKKSGTKSAEPYFRAAGSIISVQASAVYILFVVYITKEPLGPFSIA